MEVEGGEPKVEPYVGRGEVDLGPMESDHPHPQDSTITDTTMPTSASAGRQTDLERQTKAMLGVTSPSTSTSPQNRSQMLSIPPKSNQTSTPLETSTQTSNPSSPSATFPITDGRASPVRREQEIEYVRHTDGGMVQIELPPLYTDVPRRE